MTGFAGLTFAAKAVLVTSAASAAVGGYAIYQQGKDAQQQAKAEAAWHTYNSQIAKRDKEAERRAGKFETKQHRRRGKAFLSRMRSLIGSSGVEVEGSPLLTLEDSARQLALEEAGIREGGARREAFFESQSILDVSKASASKSAAAGFGRGAVVGAGASVLQGASQTGFQYYKLKN